MLGDQKKPDMSMCCHYVGYLQELEVKLSIEKKMNTERGEEKREKHGPKFKEIISLASALRQLSL